MCIWLTVLMLAQRICSPGLWREVGEVSTVAHLDAMRSLTSLTLLDRRTSPAERDCVKDKVRRDEQRRAGSDVLTAQDTQSARRVARWT